MMLRDYNWNLNNIIHPHGSSEHHKDKEVESAKKFMYIAVSGSLQDGFPLRKNLDYKVDGAVVTPAIFLGWGLIRGVKSFFDIKTLNCREHVTMGFAAINPCMVATGNRLHANVYAIYLIDTRAAVQALLGEPRYLGIVPDFAKIDLEAEETSESVKLVMADQIKHSNIKHANTKEVSIAAVISVWKGPSFVENPVLYTKSDGTEVTNFHEGIAKWAGTSDNIRTTEEWMNAIEKTIRKVEWELTEKKLSQNELYCADQHTLGLNKQLTETNVAHIESILVNTRK